MIAKMLAETGFSVVAIDCYADEDTPALDITRVAGLTVADLQSAVDDMIKNHGVTHLLYGSGFESEIASLEYLQSRFVVLGNPAGLFKRFQDKAVFFNTLDRLLIPHPETVFSAPRDTAGWLVKPLQSEGGFAITHYLSRRSVDTKRYYWQRFQVGDACSVLFVAGDGQIRLLGFNQQWVCDQHEQPFAFAGVGNYAVVSKANQVLLHEWLTKLVECYPLRGLGSLDFILHEGNCYVLEINARIPASAQLYGKSVLHWHLRACLGTALQFDPHNGLNKLPVPAAYRIIYARQPVLIPHSMVWPDWVVDRPAGGVFIGKGQPVCSIIISGNSAAQVKHRLRRLQNFIENLLQTGCYPHAIPS